MALRHLHSLAIDTSGDLDSSNAKRLRGAEGDDDVRLKLVATVPEISQWKEVNATLGGHAVDSGNVFPPDRRVEAIVGSNETLHRATEYGNVPSLDTQTMGSLCITYKRFTSTSNIRPIALGSPADVDVLVDEVCKSVASHKMGSHLSSLRKAYEETYHPLAISDETVEQTLGASLASYRLRDPYGWHSVCYVHSCLTTSSVRTTPFVRVDEPSLAVAVWRKLDEVITSLKSCRWEWVLDDEGNPERVDGATLGSVEDYLERVEENMSARTPSPPMSTQDPDAGLFGGLFGDE